MHKRRMTLAAFALLAVVLFAVLLTAPAAAQSNWSLYLLDGMTQQVVRVSLDGTQQVIDLGLPPGAYIGRQSVDFTADGNRVATCTITDADDGAHITLSARDVGSASALFSADLGKSDGCWIKYNADGSQIAAGIVRHYAGDPNADPTVPTWELLVFDAATGQQRYEMNPVKGGANFDAGRTLMPETRYFAGDLIVFAGRPWGTEGFPVSPAFLWQLTTDTLQPVDRWWHWGWDSLAYTGELAWTELDPNLPVADPGGPVPQANIVKLADDSGSERTIYANPDWVILGTQFIDNGRQLAIQELQGFVPDANGNPGNQVMRWVALGRDGAVSQLASTLGFSELVAAPDGYALLTASDNSATPVLTLEYHTGREATTLWQYQATGGVTWSILWAQPVPTDSGVQPFQAVSP